MSLVPGISTKRVSMLVRVTLAKRASAWLASPCGAMVMNSGTILGMVPPGTANAAVMRICYGATVVRSRTVMSTPAPCARPMACWVPCPHGDGQAQARGAVAT